MPAQRARAKFSGELSQPERRVESRRGIDEILRAGERELGAGAEEGLELYENCLEIDRGTAVFPGASGERSESRARIYRRWRSDYNGNGVVELGSVTDAPAGRNGVDVSQRFVEHQKVMVGQAGEFESLSCRSRMRGYVPMLLKHGFQCSTHQVVAARNQCERRSFERHLHPASSFGSPTGIMPFS
ncbi:MAG TPA: hypothetical protein VHM25_09685 [Polyangiaceae bacterium]|nr:hypothetical protein [Polyangiaceae bacterium]